MGKRRANAASNAHSDGLPSLESSRARRKVRRTERAIQYDKERGEKRRKKTKIVQMKPPATPSSTYDQLTVQAPKTTSGKKHYSQDNDSSVREHIVRNLDLRFKNDGCDEFQCCVEEKKLDAAENNVSESDPDEQTKHEFRARQNKSDHDEEMEQMESDDIISEENESNRGTIKPIGFELDTTDHSVSNGSESQQNETRLDRQMEFELDTKESNNVTYKRNESVQKKFKSNVASIRLAQSLRAQSLRKSKKIELPAMLAGVSATTLLAIDKKMKHGCLVFPRTGKPEGQNAIDFPLKNTQICDLDYQSLNRDTSAENTADLYAGYAILDLSTQWTFWDKESHRSWCPLPAASFDLMKRNPNYSTNEELRKLFTAQQFSSSFLEYDVIDLTVYHGSHFSRAFVVNLPCIKDRSWKIQDKHEDRCPCILYANSLCGIKKVHNAEGVAKVIRSFLNSYDRAVNKSTGRLFNQASLPAFGLTVPSQQDGWSCGYHTVLFRFKLMQALARRAVVFADLHDEFVSFSSEFFSYNPQETLAVRQDLLSLVRCLKRLRDRQQVVDSDVATITFDDLDTKEVITIDEGDFLPFFKRTPAARVGIKCYRSPAAINKLRMPVMQKQKQDKERLDQFHGKLNLQERSDRSTLIKKYIRPPDRRAGMAAVNLESYKDRQFRRQLSQWTRETSKFQSTLAYSSETANQLMPKCKAFGLLLDPIGQYPDRSGSQYDPLRSSPLRLAIASSKNEFDSFVDDLVENRHKYILATDDKAVDTLVLGESRPCLDEFLFRMKKKKSAQMQTENKASLANAKAVQATPVVKMKNAFYAKREVDF
jgi:hypothetical protein